MQENTHPSVHRRRCTVCYCDIPTQATRIKACSITQWCAGDSEAVGWRGKMISTNKSRRINTPRREPKMCPFCANINNVYGLFQTLFPCTYLESPEVSVLKEEAPVSLSQSFRCHPLTSAWPRVDLSADLSCTHEVRCTDTLEIHWFISLLLDSRGYIRGICCIYNLLQDVLVVVLPGTLETLREELLRAGSVSSGLTTALCCSVLVVIKNRPLPSWSKAS